MFSPQLYIPCEEKLKMLKKLEDFEECDKNIFVGFKMERVEDLDLEDLNTIRANTQKNYIQFLKKLYLYNLDNPKPIYYPLTIIHPDNEIEFSDDPTSELDRIIESGFVAHKNLRTVLFNYIAEMKKIKDKKRQRRLKYKQNKREKRENESENDEERKY